MTRTSATTILADTSAWAEFYRQTGSPTDLAMTAIIDRGSWVAVTEPVVMELLSARAPRHQVARLRRRLLSFRMLRVGGLETYERAAAIHRECRAHGETIRSLLDCLIAAVAIREDVPILAADRDFEAIARHTPLRLHPAG